MYWVSPASHCTGGWRNTTCARPAPMAGTDTRARAGRMPRFERRVLGGSLLVAAPALLALLALALRPAADATVRWIVLAVAAVLTAATARRQYRRVVFPLYTLAGLLEALREGDYSLRGVQGG